MKRIPIALVFFALLCPALHAQKKPNILFFFADDWGRYARVYSDPQRPSINDVIKTPHFDRIGREGVIFDNGFVLVSSCGPSRASLTTGRYFWNCGSGAFLNGAASNWSGHVNPFVALPRFPDLLRAAGYYARRSGKTIAFTESPAGSGAQTVPPVEYRRYGLYVSAANDEAERSKRRAETLAHPRAEMQRVLRGRGAGQPFFFIYGTINTHRPYRADSGKDLWGIDPESLKGRLPKFLPDVADVRRDFADYMGEVQAADAMLGAMLAELEAAGELDNTLVIVSGDNGIPGIPRGKTNCYDLSAQAPLMIRWPAKIKPGRRVEDFISLLDVAPTLLEVAGVLVPPEMDGRSFLPQLASPNEGWVDPARDWVVVGRELHFETARDGNLPYPMRAIRTKDYLYIRNFKPDRWPNGAPYNLEDLNTAYDKLASGPYRDLDASLTKTWLLANRTGREAGQTIELTLGKRPAEELYAVRADPDSLHNLAVTDGGAEVKRVLSARLMALLEQTNDPRLSDAFDRPPYVDPSSLEAPPREKKKGKGKSK